MAPRAHGLARTWAAALLLLAALPFAPAHAQQTREDFARRLPASDFASGQVRDDAKRFLAAPGFANARVAANPLAAAAQPVGEKVCIACHQLESEHFTHTLHALGLHAAAQADPAVPVCESCHGAGSEHARNPTGKGLIIGYTRGSATPVPASPLDRIMAAPSVMRRNASPRLVAPQTNGTVNAHLSMWFV